MYIIVDENIYDMYCINVKIVWKISSEYRLIHLLSSTHWLSSQHKMEFCPVCLVLFSIEVNDIYASCFWPRNLNIDKDIS